MFAVTKKKKKAAHWQKTLSLSLSKRALPAELHTQSCCSRDKGLIRQTKDHN